MWSCMFVVNLIIAWVDASVKDIGSYVWCLYCVCVMYTDINTVWAKSRDFIGKVWVSLTVGHVYCLLVSILPCIFIYASPISLHGYTECGCWQICNPYRYAEVKLLALRFMSFKLLFIMYILIKLALWVTFSYLTSLLGGSVWLNGCIWIVPSQMVVGFS